MNICKTFKMDIIKPKIINLPKFLDARGNLSVIEELKEIPFEIKRTYWIYDVPGGEVRGGHAYKTMLVHGRHSFAKNSDIKIQ